MPTKSGLQRGLLALAALSLLGAWLTQVTGGTIAGLGQQHLFNDSMALSLLAIGLGSLLRP